MEAHVYNLKAILQKMKNRPIGQRLYHFFWGANNMISVDQLKELKRVLESEHEASMKYIDDAIKLTGKKSSKKAA